MKRPSRDHCDGILELPFVTNDSSCPLPLAAFMKRLKPPVRLEANTIRSLLGDQNGTTFADTSLVRRVSVPRARSRSHRSVEAPFARPKATDFSSGEIAGQKTAAAAPTGPR